MRVERSLAVLSLVCGLHVTAFNSSCSDKKENEGFPPALEELNGDDYEDSLWKKIRTLLGIESVGGNSEDDLIANLSTVPTLISDTEIAATESQAQVAKVVGTAEQSVCLDIKVPLVDMNPGAAVGLSNAFSLVNGVPKALAFPAKVYTMQYKLTGDTAFRSAIVTVPSTAANSAHTLNGFLGVKSETAGAYGYPILMYGHAASSGLAYEEIAQSLGDLQMGYIIAAPTFPGEALCKTYDTVAGVKTTSCSAGNILVPAAGSSLPYENDVTEMLGLHDCMKKWSAENTGRVVFNSNNVASGTEDLSTKIVKINASAATAFASSSPIAAAAAASPVSAIAGLGRGATVAGLTLARAGALNSIFLASTPDAATVGALVAKGAKPALFSCSLLVSGQHTFTSGFNKVYLDYWAKESSSILGPSQTSLLESIPTFAIVHSKIKGIRNDANLSEDDRAKAISDYVKSIDLLLHIPLYHGGLQNFGKQFTAKILLATNPANAEQAAATVKASQGATLILHGSKDKVADVGNSILLAGVGVQTSSALVFDNIAPGVKWLSLDIEPPPASLDEFGNLPANDFGHVSSANFINGTTGQDSQMDTNVAVTEFLSLTPGAVTAKWINTQCVGSMIADPETVTP